MRSRTRSIGVAAAAVIAVFSLTACTSGTTPTEAPSTPAATQQAPQDRTAPSGFTANEQAYIDAYEFEFYTLPASDEQMLVDLGYEICTNLDTGYTVEDVIVEGIDAGVDPYEVGYITGIAIAGFCPEYQSDADAFVNEYDPAGVDA